jgi:hexosaminidase
MKIYPFPKQLNHKAGEFILPNEWVINEEMPKTETDILEGMFGSKVIKGLPHNLFLNIKNESFEYFTLEIKQTGIYITYSKDASLMYALNTLQQCFDPLTNTFSCLELYDQPVLKVRGFMLDISRNKIPTLHTLKALVDMLSRLRYNHLELYVEGFSMESTTIPYPQDEEEPFTLQEYKELEFYCQQRHIDLVPNINCFGHMTQYLAKEEFHHLAECPDGFIQWGYPFAASTLDPTNKESILLVKRMLDGFLPSSSSLFCNINGDEPFELGRGKSKEQCDRYGKGNVYVDFLLQIDQIVRSHKKIPMMWGDVLLHYPQQWTRLPKDITFIDWGYDRDYPFEEHAALLQKENITFMTAPGTSSWNSFSSRYQDMVYSIEHAIQASNQYSGIGSILTDWGDFGHLQPTIISKYAITFFGGMAYSGNSDIKGCEHYLNQYVLHDQSHLIATILRQMASYNEKEPIYYHNSTILFKAIQFVDVDDHPLELKASIWNNVMKQDQYPKKTIESFKRKILTWQKRILQTSLSSLEKSELLLVIKWMKISLNCQELMISKNKKSLIHKTIHLLEESVFEHDRLWRFSNKSSNLKKSLSRAVCLVQILNLQR